MLLSEALTPQGRLRQPQANHEKKLHLHYIHITCQELYREVEYESFIKLNEKVFEGNDIKKSIVKSILEYYKN